MSTACAHRAFAQLKLQQRRRAAWGRSRFLDYNRKNHRAMQRRAAAGVERNASHDTLDDVGQIIQSCREGLMMAEAKELKSGIEARLDVPRSN